MNKNTSDAKQAGGPFDWELPDKLADANLLLVARFAASAHRGQKRRDGITPYIEHPKAVAYKLINESEHVIMAAWLHDVLEDTKETVETMREAGVPEPVIEAVKVLTKSNGVDYHAYLVGVRANEIARKVKIADMLHNLSDAPTDRQILKYAKGLTYLLSPSEAATDAQRGGKG